MAAHHKAGWHLRLGPIVASVLLAACGGGQTPAPEAEPDRQALGISGSGSLGPKLAMSQRDAVRLADQASFGGNEKLHAELRSSGAAAWLQAQMGLSLSRYSAGGDDTIHRNVGASDFCANRGPNCWRDWYSSQPLLWDFYKNATTGGDQLRQRVAFALQQILVVSELEVNGTYGLRRYQQLMLDQAFGNYRELLRKVALSPVMGDYLDNANNDKLAPNENFARELLQLFSIGTCELEPTGALKGGSCQPTYDNAMVRHYAQALTGWTYPAGGSTVWGCWPAGTNCQYYGGDMVAAPSRHDGAERPLLSGQRKAAGSTPAQALDAVLDSLMAHPNTAPFIAQRLIQALVSSNPSGAYVQRVGAAFVSGRYTSGRRVFGQGQRGDLAATVAAVLLDTEARGDTPPPQAGRLREPVLYMTGVLRALNGRSDGEALGWWWGEALRQHVFRSPSVFNFFPPDYPVPGTPQVGPAFGIHNANSALERLNYLSYLLEWGGSAPEADVPEAWGTSVSLDAWLPQADNAGKLLDLMAISLLGRTLPEPARSSSLQAVAAWTPQTEATNWRRNRVRTAAMLIFGSPQYQVPR
jgi:hypothetical protein